MSTTLIPGTVKRNDNIKLSKRVIDSGIHRFSLSKRETTKNCIKSAVQNDLEIST